MIICLIIFILSSSMAQADIFQKDAPDLVSVFKDPYHFKRETVLNNVTRQLDMDKTIAHQIETSLKNYHVPSLINSVQRSPLMLYQYTSPAEADLFKHYQTIAHLKLNMMYGDFRDMEKSLGGDLELLRAQAEMDCVRTKLKGKTFEGDLIDLMRSCREKSNTYGIFADLNYPPGQTIHVFENIINRLNVRGDNKARMLEILPKWEINPKGYHITGPAQRIGQVLERNRLDLKDKLDDVFEEYKNEKTINPEVLKSFSLPGVSLTEQGVIDLLMLGPNERQAMTGQLLEQAAVSQAMDQYDQALEWLRRALEHPSIEEAYKNIARAGIDYLEREKTSLSNKREQIGQYAAEVDELFDYSKKERLNTISQMNTIKHRAQSRKNMEWTSHGHEQ